MAYQVVAVRVEQADANHDHVALVGYHSSHLAQEPIMLDAARVLQRVSIGDRFFMKDGDTEADLVAGKCPLCDAKPYLRTKADAGDEQKLMSLTGG